MRKGTRMALGVIAVLTIVPGVSASSQGLGSLLEREVSLIGLSPLNHFLFIVPPLVWNLALASRLSLDAFPGTVPKWYEAIEWGFRLGAMAYPIVLPIEVGRSDFAPGLVLYTAGLLLYCASWLPFVVSPLPAWARSPVFEFAPAYLPLLWLGGIALMSGSWGQAVLSVTFISLHVGEYAQRYRRARGGPTVGVAG